MRARGKAPERRDLSPTERILFDARRRPARGSSAAVRYAKNARRLAQRGAVAISAARCELNSMLLAKACLAKAELVAGTADMAEISSADREVRALERALRESCVRAAVKSK